SLRPRTSKKWKAPWLRKHKRLPGGESRLQGDPDVGSPGRGQGRSVVVAVEGGGRRSRADGASGHAAAHGRADSRRRQDPRIFTPQRIAILQFGFGFCFFPFSSSRRILKNRLSN